MGYFGADPGGSGGIAFVNRRGVFVDFIRWDLEYLEIHQRLSYLVDEWHLYGLVESVHAFPGQGVSSTFTFGQSFGALLMALDSFKHRGLNYRLITPSQWQSQMGCRTGGDKNVTKTRAQGLFPTVKVTHRNADALLLATMAQQVCADQTKHGETNDAPKSAVALQNSPLRRDRAKR